LYGDQLPYISRLGTRARGVWEGDLMDLHLEVFSIRRAPGKLTFRTAA